MINVDDSLVKTYPKDLIREYMPIMIIGEGTYGKVVKAISSKTKEVENEAYHSLILVHCNQII